MEKNSLGMRFFHLLIDLLLLNLAITLVLRLSAYGYGMDITTRKLYFLHANLAEIIVYFFYSRRNYYFTMNFFYRLKIRSRRVLVFLIALFILAEIVLPPNYPKLFLLQYSAVFFIFKSFSFSIMYRLHRYRFTKGKYNYRVAIIGSDKVSCLLGDLLDYNPKLGYQLVGYITDKDHYDENVFLGHIKSLPDIIESNDIHLVLVTSPSFFTGKKSKNLLALCNKNGIRLKFIVMDKYWDNKPHKKRENDSFFEVLNPQSIPLDDLALRLQKRLFDIFFSAFVIFFIFSWLFPIIAFLIKFESKGPVFFIQNRTGINNRTFACLKFRTMAVNKDSDSKQAQIGDSRITRIGSFLRKSNLDEFPQFINVFLGDMSIVGPRPHMLKHTTEYSALIEHYKVRHFVKPGITGWAQVNGFRGLTDELWKMEKRVEYDMEYLENWNFMWDIQIIFQTVLGKDAYKNAL